MKTKISILIMAVISIGFMVGLTGCSSLLEQIANRATEEPEVIPTPVALPTQLSSQQQANGLSCIVAQKTTIHTDENQGSLMAWRPASNELALVQPVNQYSGWYIGDLLILNAKSGEELENTKDTSVFGDLTWSPDGSAIAYISLDQQEGTYVIKILTLPEQTEIDLFGDIESAKTDDFASLKGITSWSTSSDLVVTSSCGTDCVQVYGFNPVSLALNVQDVIRQNDNNNLTYENELVSPDGKWLITLDDKDNVWLSSNESNQTSSLLTATEVFEVKWSENSNYFALRTEDQVIVHQIGCP